MELNSDIQQPLFDEKSEIELPVSAPAPLENSELAGRMEAIKLDLIDKVGGIAIFSDRIGQLIREAVDYVVDAPTLFRYSIDDLEPDEKTAIGKRIERLLRFKFKLPKGKKLDIQLGGEDVDIKTTMRSNWMFSKSSHGHVNLLIAYNEYDATYRLGLAYVLENQLGAHNRDRKQSMIAEHRENIDWILRDIRYPANLLAGLPKETLSKITYPKSGAKRVAQLLRLVQGKAIPRHIICSVANQKDPLKRIRRNGGARDGLWAEGLLILSGRNDSDRRIAKDAIGILLSDDETMSVISSDYRLTQNDILFYKNSHALP